MRGLAVAAAFLTRIPVPVRVEGPPDLARSVVWFPVVGAGLGLVVGGVLVGLGMVLPPMVAAAGAVAAGLLLTGAFHEDGLADTFDGLGGGRDRLHALEIMQDSRLGTFGAAALVVALIARVALLAAVLTLAPLPVLMAVGAISRGAAVGAMGLSPSATGAGLGASYLSELRGWQVAVGAVLSVGIGLGLLGMEAVAAIAAAAIGGGLVVAWARARVGGLTGDVLGAVQQVAELAALAAVVGATG